MTIGEKIKQEKQEQYLNEKTRRFICMRAFTLGVDKTAEFYKMTQQNVSKIVKKYGHTAFLSYHQDQIKGKTFAQKRKIFKENYNYKS